MVLLRILIVLVLSIGALPVAAQSRQSSGKIIDRYKKAVGGNAAKRVRAAVVRGVVTTDDGSTGTYLLRTSKPDRYRIDIAVGDLMISECYNGKSAWRHDGRGLRTLLGPEAEKLRLIALLANSRLHDLSRDRIVISSPTRIARDGYPAEEIRFSMGQSDVRLLFDPRTGLIAGSHREGAEGPEEIRYAAYGPVNGVQEPFELLMQLPGARLRVAVSEVLHKAPDLSAFNHPQIGSEAPPNVDELLGAVMSNQEQVESLTEQYTFRSSVTEHDLDGKGQVKDEELKEFEVTPVAGRFIRRLVKRNGVELSEAEQEKEDRRVRKEIENALREQEKRQKRRERDRMRGKEEDDDDRLTMMSFLRVSEVTSVRREVFRGHPVVAFDFEPRRGIKPRNRIEGVVSKLAGTIWVDEEARQIVRLEARLTDPYRVGGGLVASLAPSSAVVFEQQKIDGDIWLPSFDQVDLSVRVFLLARFHMKYTARHYDYRRYKIDSEYDLAKPDQEKKDR